jgi:hypothetical protein
MASMSNEHTTPKICGSNVSRTDLINNPLLARLYFSPRERRRHDISVVASLLHGSVVHAELLRSAVVTNIASQEPTYPVKKSWFSLSVRALFHLLKGDFKFLIRRSLAEDAHSVFVNLVDDNWMNIAAARIKRLRVRDD